MRPTDAATSTRKSPADAGERPLAIHTDRRYLVPGAPHVPLLAPIWGPPDFPPAHPDLGMYDAFARTGETVVRLVPPEEADAFVLPSPWSRLGAPNPEAHQMASDAQKAGKPLLVFFLDDSDEVISLPGALIFRSSFRRSKRRPNEHALSAPGEDILAVHCEGQLRVRIKTDRPVVGFCGQSMTHDEYRATRIKAAVYHVRALGSPWQYRPWLAADFGRRIRMEALESVQASKRVMANIIVRHDFMNGVDFHDPAKRADAQATRREYVANLLGSDYVLCPRGTGNFSFRFYETLCCGRIPVVIDTDIALPYEDWIDWRRHCVWVPQAHVTRTADYVAEFHTRLTPQEFEERQWAARVLWETWLSPLGFHANLYRYIRGSSE